MIKEQKKEAVKAKAPILEKKKTAILTTNVLHNGAKYVSGQTLTSGETETLEGAGLKDLIKYS